MNKKMQWMMAIGMALLFLPACRPVIHVSAATQQPATMATCKTFAFDTTRMSGVKDTARIGRIEKEIRSALVNHGYVEDTANTDMMIRIEALVKAKQYSTSISSFSKATDLTTMVYWSQYGKETGVTRVEDSPYRDGSLLITATHTRSGSRLWTGSVSAELTRHLRKSNTYLSEAISRLMRSFPAAAALAGL